jgi:hypothetical protein
MAYFGLLVLLVLGYLIYHSAYKAGKREGSRKGYGVGFARGRQSRNEGCPLTAMFVLLIFLLASKAVASLIGW